MTEKYTLEKLALLYDALVTDAARRDRQIEALTAAVKALLRMARMDNRERWDELFDLIAAIHEAGRDE